MPISDADLQKRFESFETKFGELLQMQNQQTNAILLRFLDAHEELIKRLEKAREDSANRVVNHVGTEFERERVSRFKMFLILAGGWVFVQIHHDALALIGLLIKSGVITVEQFQNIGLAWVATVAGPLIWIAKTKFNMKPESGKE